MCNVLCRKTLDSKTAKAFKEKIDDEYRVNMYETLFLGMGLSTKFREERCGICFSNYSIAHLTGSLITFLLLFPSKGWTRNLLLFISLDIMLGSKANTAGYVHYCT